MGRVFPYAMQHDAITANPLERVDFSANRATGDRKRFSRTPSSGIAMVSLVLTLVELLRQLWSVRPFGGLTAAI